MGSGKPNFPGIFKSTCRSRGLLLWCNLRFAAFLQVGQIHLTTHQTSGRECASNISGRLVAPITRILTSSLAETVQFNQELVQSLVILEVAVVHAALAAGMSISSINKIWRSSYVPAALVPHSAKAAHALCYPGIHLDEFSATLKRRLSVAGSRLCQQGFLPGAQPA